jgi:hypothetical protein
MPLDFTMSSFKGNHPVCLIFSGPNFVSVYGGSHMQKYFRRQLKQAVGPTERFLGHMVSGHLFLLGRSYKLALGKFDLK